MAKTLRLERRGDMLIAADNESLDAVRGLPEGRPLNAQVVVPRNEAFHRKLFSLLRLAFDYWQPTNYLTNVERHTVRQLHDYLIRRGLTEEAVSGLCTDFLRGLNEHRQEFEFAKDIGAFREFVTVEAGFYDTVISPAGPRRVAKSWSFAKMDEEEFARMYKAIFDVVWSLVLKQHFESPEAADAAAEQLLSYT